MKKILLKLYYKVLKQVDLLKICYNKNIVSKLKKPKVNTTDETLNKIINSNCSVSRYGDGEFALMNGQNLGFQRYDLELSNRLKSIIKSNEENHIVCIPNVFSSLDWCTEKSKVYWIKYLNLNLNKIYKLLDMNKNYFDTQVTRLYIDHKDKSNVCERFNKFKQVWKNRDIVIVEGEQSRLGIGNDLFNNVNSIKRIICPPKDAYNKYYEILNEVKKQEKDKLILIALGPTATVLAYDLAIEGYQAIDIGHIDIEYEWFLKGVSEKQPVENKFIGEVENTSEIKAIEDIDYNSQIICNIIGGIERSL